MSTARVTWLQLASGTRTARVTWLQVSSGAGINAAIAQVADTLAAAAIATAAASARVTWLQLQESVGAPADAQVAGSWTPALLSRWLLLAGGEANRLAAISAQQQSDAVTSAAVAVVVSRVAAAAIVSRADSLAAAATGVVPTFGPPDYTWAVPSSERRVGTAQIATGSARVGGATITKG